MRDVSNGEESLERDSRKESRSLVMASFFKKTAQEVDLFEQRTRSQKKISVNATSL